MKLAEALMLRREYQTKLDKLKHRVLNNVKVQEGEEVTENPNDLLEEMSIVLDNLESLIVDINKTNSLTVLYENTTIASALAKRDLLGQKRSMLEQIVASASVRQNRISRSEIKFVTTIDIMKVQKEIDQISKEYRMIDTKIQEKNWLIDLLN